MSEDVQVTWAGKRPATLPDPPPTLKPMETAGLASTDAWRNKLIHGDNLPAMAALLPALRGKFALIYLDPPFFTGKEWKSRTPGSQIGYPVPPQDRPERLLKDLDAADPQADFTATTQAPESTKIRVSNAQGAPEIENPTGFSDDWTGGLGAYLQWLFDRMTAAHALLADDGCLYLHLSWHSVHYAKLLLDEIFGVEQFQNEIVWCYREAINSKKRWNRKHDTLLFYSKGERFTFNYDLVREPYSESTVKKFRSRDEKGPYRLMGRGITDSPLRSKRDIAPEMETLFPELTYRHYLGEGTLPLDYWHIDIENQASKSRTGYPTQKPEALLERILLASSNEGDLIGDFCSGSGTTLVVANRMGRRWIGCDAGPHAVDTSRARLVSQGASFDEFRVEL